MRKTKKANKQNLVNRLERVLLEVYHNATPNYPVAQNDYESDLFESWFELYASDAVSDLNGYVQKKVRNNIGRYRDELHAQGKSHKVSAKRSARLYSEMDEFPRYRVPYMFGELYSWGRGGRTLAPEGIVKQRGGSSFSIKTAEALIDDRGMTREDITNAIIALEDFNQYIADWNQGVAAEWEYHKQQDEDIQKDIDEHEGKKRVTYQKTEYR